MRIIIEIEDNKLVGVSAHPGLTSVIPPAKHMPSPSVEPHPMPPPELLKVAEKLGAQNAGQAPIHLVSAVTSISRTPPILREDLKTRTDVISAGPAPEQPR